MTDPAIEAARRYWESRGTAIEDAYAGARNGTVAAAREALAPIRALHKAFGVYGDDCDHEPVAGIEYDDKHCYVEEFGWTCDHLYDICGECCTSNGYQTEDCATYHDHGPGKPICATALLAFTSDEIGNTK